MLEEQSIVVGARLLAKGGSSLEAASIGRCAAGGGMKILASGLVLALSGFCSLHAGAAPVSSDSELKPPLAQAPDVVFNPSQCAADPGGSVSATHLVVRTGKRRIGPYAVALDGFVSPGVPEEEGYRPILIEADAGSVLRIDLENRLADGKESLTNLHTHGLIVRPTPYDATHRCPGDSVFQFVPPAAAGDAVASRRQYRIDVPAHAIPASFFDLGGEALDHPSGLFWFHAHWHGLARPQVTSGMAGLISIGDPMTHLRVDRIEAGVSQVDEAATRALRSQTDVRYLALRDIQVDVPTCDAASPGCKPEAVLPGNTGAAPLDAAVFGYTPDLCQDTPAAGSGWCASPKPADDRHAAPYQRVWLFTVNGQLVPDIKQEAGRNHLWRIANLSASVSYALDVVDGNGAEQGFCVVSIDGVVAGSTGGAAQACEGAQPQAPGYGSVGLSRQRILMMPGSRAEVFWRYPAGAGAQASYRLRTLGLNMGNSDPKTQGDQWPATDLATISVAPSPEAAAPRPVMLNARLRAAVPSAAVPAKPATGAPAGTLALPARGTAARPQLTRQDIAWLEKRNKGCQFLPAGQGFRRQIVFDEREGSGDGNSTFNPDANYPEGSFELGFRAVRGKLGTGDNDPRLGVPPAPYVMPGMAGAKDGAHSPMHGSGTPAGATDLPAGPRPCTVLGRGEVWELVNWTTETHNFHIHQGKFRLARTGDPGLPSGLNAVVFGEKPEHSPIMGYLGQVADTSGDVQAWHDTMPVPPRIEDDGPVRPGRIFVYIPFAAPQQEGYFVFHCHILEHEDRGMMANVQVVRSPRGPKVAGIGTP